ncbi:hypothetical protein L210DRAFT_3562706 [Boletus edulis BED1]|uniref:Uncharacterized protein n=1 Tax=Boletus edulis BED1 TaxID=1328754 RepID=A0AAD4BGM2_BOLED|nr:hypothetical protein L210DRAFT_3562706 [Boletus edulis BED1]
MAVQAARRVVVLSSLCHPCSWIQCRRVMVIQGVTMNHRQFPHQRALHLAQHMHQRTTIRGTTENPLEVSRGC